MTSVEPTVSHLPPILANEKRLGTRAAAKLVGTAGTTVFRWIQKGVLLPSGERVKLEAVRLGNRYFTSEEALARFVAATTGGASGPQSPAPPTPAQQRRAAARDSAELDRLGFTD